MPLTGSQARQVRRHGYHNAEESQQRRDDLHLIEPGTLRVWQRNFKAANSIRISTRNTFRMVHTCLSSPPGREMFGRSDHLVATGRHPSLSEEGARTPPDSGGVARRATGWLVLSGRAHNPSWWLSDLGPRTSDFLLLTSHSSDFLKDNHAHSLNGTNGSKGFGNLFGNHDVWRHAGRQARARVRTKRNRSRSWMPTSKRAVISLIPPMDTPMGVPRKSWVRA